MKRNTGVVLNVEKLYLTWSSCVLNKSWIHWRRMCTKSGPSRKEGGAWGAHCTPLAKPGASCEEWVQNIVIEDSICKSFSGSQNMPAMEIS